MNSRTNFRVEAYVENLAETEESDLLDLPWQQWLQIWLEELEPYLPPAQGYELSLRLTSDREIRKLNHQYRQKDQPTDVLAFASLEAEFPQLDELQEPLYLGDIVISLDTARQQAQAQAHSLTVELGWLVSHGLLHLLGWDHPDESSLEKMLHQQSKFLKNAEILA
jgi:probable rRNA maturation factor